MKSTWTKVGDLLIHARVSEIAAPADDRSIVLVHGLGVSSRYMLPTAIRLAPHYKVYAIDLPGFGKSAKPQRALDVHELSDALAAWAEATGLNRAAFVGNSFGCQIITDLILRYPQYVERAVFVAPTVDPQARTAFKQILKLILNIPHEPFSLVPLTVHDYLTAGLGRAWRTLRFALRDPIEEKLARVQVPTLVVRGGRDPMVPQSWVERATKLLPLGCLVVIPKAGHAVNYNSPEELARVVMSFLCERETSRVEEDLVPLA